MTPGRESADPSDAAGDGPLAVLTARPELPGALAAAAAGRRVLDARDAGSLVAAVIDSRPRLVVLDRASAPTEADAALPGLQRLARRSELTIVVVDPEAAPPPIGADAVIVGDAAASALASLGWTRRAYRASAAALDQLLAVSLLPGSLDQGLQAAADQLAAGFGVDRCLISIRGDSAGGAAATGTRTWSQLGWSQTAARCHAAVAAEATLIAPAADDPSGCESYLAVPLESAHGRGFVGLVVTSPTVFPPRARAALAAAARRFATELGWRSRQDKAAEELDRAANAPGFDGLLGIWNRTALKQLAAMQVSASRRTKFPLSVAVLDVVDMQGINNRAGLEAGDRLLRRLADAVRRCVRDEDVVGRLAGDEIAVVLHGTSAEGAHKVAERLLGALQTRPIELANGDALPIHVTIGLASLEPAEGPVRILTRAARAATKARAAGVSIATADRSGPTSSPGLKLAQHTEDADDISATLGGAYRLIHEISRGGMGVVYRATDLALQRPVAIKMLRPDLAEDRELVHRFRIEAAMLAHLQHPNLVQVYSFGHNADDTYFVMELVEGESLEQAMVRHQTEGTTVPFAELVTTVNQIAAALDALHDRGIVHRDVKPANVIRDPFRGRNVLVDVGIARRYGQHAVSAGTPGYVAPEVIAHQDATVRSDVYGLAATVYAMLTLTPPWGDGDLPTLLARQRGDQLAAPSTFRPELAPVDGVILAAMSPEPARRPASAGELARRLTAALAIVDPPKLPDADAGPGRAARAATTTSAPVHGDATTRGVVFRSVPRALGVRESERLRDAIGGTHPALARALGQETAPLVWLPTELLIDLLVVAPPQVGRDRERFARDLARATVRASFRRFFPASSATLVPERTLSAIRSVWARYHSWGTIAPMPVHTAEVVVKLAETLREPALCEWTQGMLEQLVVLSGGPIPEVAHEECEARGDDACLFRVTWGPPS